MSRLVPAHRFHSFWEEYAERGVPVVRYERLLADTKRELVRLFERWSEPYNEHRLDEAIKLNSLAKLKADGKKLGDIFIANSHFRAGQSGYAAEFPTKILEDVERRFGHVLQRWGYELHTRS